MAVEKNVTRISSLQKALRVLDFIGVYPEGCEIKEVSYGIGINISTCYHILNTLVDEDYLMKQVDGRYILGPKIPSLNNAFINSMNPEISLLNELNNLHKQTGETVNLLSVNANEIFIQSVIEGIHPLKVGTLYKGYSGNDHARSSVKSILAYWQEEEINKRFEEYNFIKFTSKTPGNLMELKAELRKIRKQGFSLDVEA